MKKKQKKIKELDILTAYKSEERRKERNLKRRRFLTGLISVVVILVVVAYLTNRLVGKEAQVKNIMITGNLFFTDRQIIAKAAVDYNDNFFLLNTGKIEKRFADWDICSVKVYKRANQVLEICFDNVDLLAYYSEASEPGSEDRVIYFVDSTGRTYKFTNEYYDVLKLLPYLVDYNESERLTVVEHLKVLDRRIVYQIAEIVHHFTTYDENMLKLTMEDGNQIVLDYDSIELLRNYNDIVENLNKKNSCLFFDKSTSSAYAAPCKEDENEY